MPHMQTWSAQNVLLGHSPIGMPWPTLDPFLPCVHHDDRYPRGNGRFGPLASLGGRQIGSDFSGKDGWSLYHGGEVPGFPAHPHRGFETVTLVRRGRVDHADSLGAAARYGDGDVQWLTAGRGIVHSEMFPLLDATQDNPLEMFQIWLNLPARSKMCEPGFAMLWAERIPRATFVDAGGARTEVVVVAGRLPALAPTATALEPLPPPPDSWASDPQAVSRNVLSSTTYEPFFFATSHRTFTITSPRCVSFLIASGASGSVMLLSTFKTCARAAL